MSRFTPLLSSCLVIILLAGCGGSSTVTGKISHEGKPLNSGEILFQSDDGTVQSATIQSDGTYTVTDLPAGKAKIAINVSPPPVQGPDGVSADEPGSFEANPVLIPLKYGKVETSELTYEVTGGSQTHDIDLK